MTIKSIQSGGASTPEAILSAFRGFITDTTNGWTEDAWSTTENSNGNLLALTSPDGHNVAIVGHDTASGAYQYYRGGVGGGTWTVTGLAANAFNGTYSGAKEFHQQTGCPFNPDNAGQYDVSSAALAEFSNSANYWFYCFSCPDLAVIVIEDADNEGEYRYLWFGGVAENYGSVTNGTIIGGSRDAKWNTPSTTDGMDSFPFAYNNTYFSYHGILVGNDWHGGGSGGGTMFEFAAIQSADRFSGGALLFTPNSWSGLPILFPIELFQYTSANDIQPIGDVENIRVLKTTTLTMGELITIGNQQWRIFPFFKKGSDESQQHGFAVLEVES